MTIQKNNFLELIALNGSFYIFELLFDERKTAFDYKCKKVKAGETYELENAVYLAMGLDKELEERTLKLWREKNEPVSLYEGEIGLALNSVCFKPSEKNFENAKKVIELIKEYNTASRVFLTIGFNKGLALPDSRVVYFNKDNQKLVHSGPIKIARIRLAS